MSRERTMNSACLAPLSLASCRFIQCFPDRTCSTTVSPGAASGLLAVITAAFALELLSLADTGGTTMTSTGLLTVPAAEPERGVHGQVRGGYHGGAVGARGRGPCPMPGPLARCPFQEVHAGAGDAAGRIRQPGGERVILAGNDPPVGDAERQARL